MTQRIFDESSCACNRSVLAKDSAINDKICPKLGSVAERLVVAATGPVLIAVQPLEQIEQVIVAYDGSDAAIGALRMGKNLALKPNHQDSLRNDN